MKILLQWLLDVAGFLAFVFRRWNEDHCPQIAASLTFTTSLALVPLFTVVVTLLSVTPFFEEVMTQIKIFLLMNLQPEIAGKIITVYMTQFATNAGHLTTLSLGALFVTTLVTLYTVDESLNLIWRVRRGRKLWLSAMAYVGVLAVGPLLIGISMSLTSYFVTLSMSASDLSPQAESMVLRVVPLMLGALAFFALYRIIPNRHVPALHAAVGGAFAAILFEVMKAIFSTYIRLVPTYSLVYGTFASIPIFLLWMYFSWLVVLLGAELTASLAHWRHRSWRRTATPNVRFREALQIGRRLAEAKGESVSLDVLRAEIAVPSDELEDTLASLEEMNLVRRDGRSGYSLAKAPEAITLGELYNVAVHSGQEVPPDIWTDYSPELAEAAQAMESAFSKPLGSLSPRADAGTTPAPAPAAGPSGT